MADCIASNSKAIIDYVQKFAQTEQERFYKKQKEKSVENISKYSKELKNTSNAVVLNINGIKEFIEFFDYNCVVIAKLFIKVLNNF